LHRISPNWWIFAIWPNCGGFKYFRHKCGGFLELTQRRAIKPDILLEFDLKVKRVGDGIDNYL
jgi:hypothetical protein